MRKGTPKKDGSGGGKRQNRGRGGCKSPRKIGKGSGTKSGRGGRRR